MSGTMTVALRVCLGIGLARQGLDLKQWEIGSQMHRLMGSGETEIGEQRTEPAIRLDNAFVKAVAARGCQIRRRTHQQAPVWGRARHQPGPDLHDAWFRQGGEKRRRAATQRD